MLENLSGINQFADVIQAPMYWLDVSGVVTGANQAAVDSFGFDSKDQMIGNKIHQIFPDVEMIDSFNTTCDQIYKTGTAQRHKELILNRKTGLLHCYKSVKSPLFDEQRTLVGLVNLSIELNSTEFESTNYVKNKKDGMLKYLEILASTLPINLYWEDVNSVVLGGNESILKAVGANSLAEVLGKSLYDFYPYDMAHKIVQHNNEVMRTGKVLAQEEEIRDIATGNMKYFIAIKAPLRDDDQNIIGIIGTSIEITAEKEARQLRLEGEKQKIELEAQEKFRQDADKVAHDIRSPLMSLLILAKSCTAIPERERITLREAATSINDIANNLLRNYPKNATQQAVGAEEAREPILISPVILQMLTEKRYQYQGRPVSFSHNFSQVGEFSWINIQPSAFKRTISNIINNAVDAFDQKDGKIIVHLNADDSEVRLTIEDNGKGMSPALRQKIMDQIAVTEGKADGHGIGLTQVRETLQNNQGQWDIDSTIGAGTKIILTFPRTLALPWIADTIQINDNDTIIILDDDRSIHTAWDLRFEALLKDYPALSLEHFTIGQEAVDFICGLNASKQKSTFLLSDYELLEQKITGLNVIEQTKIERSVLVTSHYGNKKIQKAAVQLGTKILPKELASDVPIHVDKVIAACDPVVQNSDRIKMDVIFVDDEQYLLDGFKMFSKGKKVDTYQDPQEFLDKVDKYHRDTKIMLDQNFENYHLKGADIAEKLNSMGFTRLYLLSGNAFSLMTFPRYVMPILKTDLDALEIALNE